MSCYLQCTWKNVWCFGKTRYMLATTNISVEPHHCAMIHNYSKMTQLWGHMCPHVCETVEDARHLDGSPFSWVPGSFWFLPAAHKVFLFWESSSIWGPLFGFPVPLIMRFTIWVRMPNVYCWLDWKWEQKCVKVFGLPAVKPPPSDELRHVEINPGHLGERLGIWCPNGSLLIYYAAIWLNTQEGSESMWSVLWVNCLVAHLCASPCLILNRKETVSKHSTAIQEAYPYCG